MQLKDLRESKVLSQEDLAKLSGLSPATISEIERGKRRPHFITIRKLADALEIDPELLVFLS